MALEFEWDTAKAELNLKEHGVSFDDATTVFRDPLSITIVDPDHSDFEHRFRYWHFSSWAVACYIVHGA
jgi:uncharacterized protein